MTKVNSVLLLPVGREWCSGQPGLKERVYEAVIEEKTKDYIFLRICRECCDELGLLPDRELQVPPHHRVNQLTLLRTKYLFDHALNQPVGGVLSPGVPGPPTGGETLCFPYQGLMLYNGKGLSGENSMLFC